MITDSFDNLSQAIINPVRKENAPAVDACIVTFSHDIEKYVAENYASGEITSLWCATGRTPVYLIEKNGKRFAFYKTYVGAPITVGLMEDAAAEMACDRFILFGGAGCLNKEIAHGKVMVPTDACRDEGTSYHYAPASDWITVRNAPIVARFMEDYRESVICVQDNAHDAAQLIGEFGIFEAGPAEKALPYCNITFIDGEDLKTKLSGYLDVLFEADPASVGGAVPGEDFYY